MDELVTCGMASRLIPAHVLGALDSAESKLLGAHLSDCAGCCRQLASFRAVADGLTLVAQQVSPSPDLRRRVLAEAQGSSPAGSPAVARDYQAHHGQSNRYPETRS